MPSSVLIWMDTLSTCSPGSNRDSGSKIRSKFHRHIFACCVQGKIPLSLVSFLFFWSEMICMLFFCKFIPLFALSFIRLRVVIHEISWISEKSIMNTCKMFTLRVDILSASLPRIPSQMLLSLYFGLAMSSTMSGSFLSRSSG